MGLSYFEWLLAYPLTVPVCIFGIIGNFISVLVWQRIRKRSSSQCRSSIGYFIVLSACDVLLLISCLFGITLIVARPSLKTNYSFGIFFRFIANPIHQATTYFSLIIISCFSVQRAQVIIYPLSNIANKLKSQTQIIIGVSIVISILFAIPTFLEYEQVDINNTTRLVRSDLVKEQRQSLFFFMTFTTKCIVATIATFTVILVANAIIIVKQLQRIKLQMNLPSTQSRNICKTLLMMSALMISFWSVRCTISCIAFFTHKEYSMWYNSTGEPAVATFAVTLHSAIIVMVYCLPSREFRREFAILLHLAKPPPKRISSITTVLEL